MKSFIGDTYCVAGTAFFLSKKNTVVILFPGENFNFLMISYVYTKQINIDTNKTNSLVFTSSVSIITLKSRDVLVW